MQIGQHAGLRWTLSLVRTCEFAPTTVMLAVTCAVPPGIYGTMSGHWVNGTHANVQGLRHDTMDDLVVFALHEDGHTKMAGWRVIDREVTGGGGGLGVGGGEGGGGGLRVEHVEGRAHVGSLAPIEVQTISRTWDSATTRGVSSSCYMVSDIKQGPGIKRQLRSDKVHLGRVEEEVVLHVSVASGLHEIGECGAGCWRDTEAETGGCRRSMTERAQGKGE